MFLNDVFGVVGVTIIVKAVVVVVIVIIVFVVIFAVIITVFVAAAFSGQRLIVVRWQRE